MPAPRFKALDTVLRHVWDEIETAAEMPGHAYRRLTFGTAEQQAPDLRTVVLRAASETHRTLQFHTDRRSRKVDTLRQNDRIAWHGWDDDSRQQIRLYGTGSVHFDDEVAMSMWEAQRPKSLAVYVRPSAPGSPLNAPDDGLRTEVKTTPITEEDVAEGRQHFAAVRTVIDRIEWLHLHPDGHYRAQFEYQPSEQDFKGRWVVP